MRSTMSSEICRATEEGVAGELWNAALELFHGGINDTYNNLMVYKMARSDQFAEVCFKNQGSGPTKALFNPGVKSNNAE